MSSTAGYKCMQVIKGLLLPAHKLSCVTALLRNPPLHAVRHPSPPGVSIPSQTTTSCWSSTHFPQGPSSWVTSAHDPAHGRRRVLRAGTEKRGNVLGRCSCGSPSIWPTIRVFFTQACNYILCFHRYNLLIVQALTQENLKTFKTTRL